MNQEEIIDYFDESKIAYKDVWHLDTCLALHYGFWEKGVSNLKEALIKENEVLSKIIGIKSTDVVLDSGCGVGGSSIYLAKNFKCKAHGITISKDQQSTAIEAAKKQGVSDLVNFTVTDFHSTPFEDNSFDVIWFVESFCHALDSEKVLREMYRVLKPNGRILITDAFLAKKENSAKDNLLMDNWLNNWGVDTIEASSSMTEYMANIGFSNINNLDYSKKIARSALLLYVYAILGINYGRLRKLVGKSYGTEVTRKNSLGAKYQYIAFRKKLWTYNILTATKPGDTI